MRKAIPETQRARSVQETPSPFLWGEPHEGRGVGQPTDTAISTLEKTYIEWHSPVEPSFFQLSGLD